MLRGLFVYSFYSGKGIELYIRLFGNASKMRGELKFAIKMIPSFFSSLLFLTVTLLDTRSVWSSSLLRLSKAFDKSIIMVQNFVHLFRSAFQDSFLKGNAAYYGFFVWDILWTCFPYSDLVVRKGYFPRLG